MKKWMKRIGLGVAILLVVFLLTRAVADAVWSAEFENEIQVLKNSGAKLHLPDFAPPPIPEQDNAASLYMKAHARCEKLIENEAPCGRILDASDYRRQPLETTRAWIDSFREPLALVREASKKPGCRFDVDYSKGLEALLPHLTTMIFLSKLLVAQAYIQSRSGEYSEAAESIRQILASAAAFKTDPFLVSQLIRVVLVQMAVQALQENPLELSKDQWLELAKAFDPSGFQEDFVRSLEAERALAISTLTDMPEVMAGSHQTAWVLAWPIRPIIKKDAAEYARRSTRLIELARLDFAQAQSEMERLSREKTWYSPLSSLLVPMIAPCRESHTAALAELAIARQVCKFKASGIYPESFELIDPFTGKPMSYRREGSGFVFECSRPKDRPVKVRIEK